MASSREGLTRNDFLNGALKVWQPKQGYRAGVDPVLLAACVPAKPGQSVLELGCGAGVASLCLGQRVLGLHLFGVELQPGYAALAEMNAKENHIDLDVSVADIAALPDAIRQRQFDHVFANPPYFDRARGSIATDDGREKGRGETVDLGVWVQAASRRLRPGGLATFIQRADRLPELSGQMAVVLGDIGILPIAPRVGRSAGLVVVQGKKGARGAARLLAPLVLHDGVEHETDGDDYSVKARQILREGAEIRLDR